MKNRILMFVIILVLCAGFTWQVSADEGFVEESYRVQDFAELLSEDECESLAERLDELSHKHNVDVIVFTTDNMMGWTNSEYAENWYDYCKFGYGEDKDGVMLLLNMVDRDWYIATCGYGIQAFTDVGIDYIGEQIKDDLSEGAYAEAFEKFADICDDFITQAKNGTPYDNNNSVDATKEPLSAKWIVIAVVAGVLIAVIVVMGMKSQLKTVEKKVEANNYMKKGSLNIDESRDIFLYDKLTRTEKPKDNNSSGSSTHSSSRGTTHGGGGGGF